MTERQCGSCTLCCKLLPMSKNAPREERLPETLALMVERGLATAKEFEGMLVEFDKPAGQRCPYQKHHKGCSIYPRRPFGCRYWNCRWLVNEDAADLSRPDRAGYVIDIMPDFITLAPHDGGPSTNIEVIQIWVDPSRPDAYRDPKLRAWLERRGKEGKAALIRFNESDALTLFPPSMSDDCKWHEVHGKSDGRTRGPEERWDGLASAANIRMNFSTEEHSP